MSDLKPCPFCGGEAELCYSEVDTFCRKCNVMQETELWNTRPIEDELHSRIAELEAAQRWHVVKECNDVATPIDVALRKRIAELEGKIDQLTAHDATERQDDKWIPVSEWTPEVQESEATSCKFCGSNKSDRRMNSIVCSSCGRKIGNVAPPEVQE